MKPPFRIFRLGCIATVLAGAPVTVGREGGRPLTVGCSPQADSAYRGEPIATFHGSVVTQDQPVPSGISAAIIYYYVDQNHPTPSFVGARTPVAGSYPANFTLTVYDPPPAEAVWRTGSADTPGIVGVGVGDMNVPGGQPLGVWAGYLVALSPSWAGPGVQPSDIVGVDTSHTVLYFDHDVPDAAGGSSIDIKEAVLGDIARTHHVTPTKGYHLTRIDPGIQNAVAQLSTCQYGNLCVEEKGATGFDQAQRDWNYTRCHDLLPNNPTCKVTVNADGGDLASWTTQCQPPWQEPNCMAYFPSGTELFDDNPNGLADPATVYLGKTIWDLYESVP